MSTVTAQNGREPRRPARLAGGLQSAPAARRRASDRVFVPGIALGAIMAVTIAGTLVGGRFVAFASIPFYLCAVVILALRDPNAAVCVYLAYSAMEGMFKYLSGFAQAVYAIKPILLGVIVIGWLLRARARRDRVQMPPLSKGTVLLLLWGLAQVFHPMCRGIAEGVVTLLIWYVLPAAFMPLAYNVSDRATKQEQIRFALVAVATVVSAFAILQFAMGREWTQAHLPGYDKMTASDWWTTDETGKITYAAFRPASTTSQGGGGGYWGHLGAMLAVGMLATPGLSLRCRAGVVSCLLLNVMGIFVCGVRLYVVLALVEMALWILFTARGLRELIRNVGLALVALGVVTGAFVGAQALTGGKLGSRFADTLSDPVGRYQQERAKNFEYLPWLFASHPLGIGYQRGLGGGKEEQQGEILANRENQFNSIAADMGLPGLLILSGLMVAIPVVGFRALRAIHSRNLRPSGGMLLALLVGYLVMGLAGPSLQGADFYWLFAGMLMAMPAMERRAHAGSRVERVGT